MRATINTNYPLYVKWWSVETTNHNIKTESCLTYAGGEGWTQGKIKTSKLLIAQKCDTGGRKKKKKKKKKKK
jgi:hypothetical protein